MERIDATNRKHYKNIANAIRKINRSNDLYKPRDMAKHILALEFADGNIYKNLHDSQYSRISMEIEARTLRPFVIWDLDLLEELYFGRLAPYGGVTIVRGGTAGRIPYYLNRPHSLNTCTGLKSLAVSDYIYELTSSTWAFPSSLEEVSFSNALMIGSSTFNNLPSLSTVTFPAAISVGYAAFRSTPISQAAFPNCLWIDGAAFYGCTSLREANFDSCLYVGASAFERCTSLSAINLPNCTMVSSRAFSGCTKLLFAHLGNCCTLNSAAFYGCTSLRYVDIPICTHVSSWAFWGCSSLESFCGLEVTYIGSAAFSGCVNLAVIDLPVYSGSISSSFALSCSRLAEVFIPSVPPSAVDFRGFRSTPIYHSSYIGIYGSIYTMRSLYDGYLAYLSGTSSSFLHRLVYMEAPSALSIDSAIDSSSINPVENRAIQETVASLATTFSPSFTGIPIRMNSNVSAVSSALAAIGDVSYYAPPSVAVNSAFCAALPSLADLASPILTNVPRYSGSSSDPGVPATVGGALQRASAYPMLNKTLCFLLSRYAVLSSPSLVGVPTVPTQSQAVSNTTIATTAYAISAANAARQRMSSVIAWRNGY